MSVALCGNPSQSYGASPALWDHTALSANHHGWMCPHSHVHGFTCPRGM